jgi:methylated-DNA-[protein]-cysteine S-methyltransferase
MRFFDAFRSPLGTLYLIFSDNALEGIAFEKPPLRPGRAPAPFKKQLAEYFGGRSRRFRQAIRLPQGTDFEKKVWLALRDVPYGQTRTYKWLAEKVGRPGASRAVGQALSKNPIPIVLPCHRIIESDGNIGGYSSGVDVKRRLLDMEYYHSLSHEGPA